MLLSCENHVDGAASRAESTLALEKQVMFQVCVETIEQNAGHNLPSIRKQRDAAVIVTGVYVPFALVEVGNGIIFMLLW